MLNQNMLDARKTMIRELSQNMLDARKSQVGTAEVR